MRFSESITIDVVSRIAHNTKCHLLTQNLGMTVIMAKTQRRKIVSITIEYSVQAILQEKQTKIL